MHSLVGLKPYGVKTVKSLHGVFSTWKKVVLALPKGAEPLEQPLPGFHWQTDGEVSER